MKIWGEVLELMVGPDKSLFIKWSKMSTDTTTTVKRTHNDNKSHTIGYEQSKMMINKKPEYQKHLSSSCHNKLAASCCKTYIDVRKFLVEKKV